MDQKSAKLLVRLAALLSVAPIGMRIGNALGLVSYPYDSSEMLWSGFALALWAWSEASWYRAKKR